MRPEPGRQTRAARAVALAAAGGLLACASDPTLFLMETPAIYHEAAIDPFAHLDDSHRSTEISVFYATLREPRQGDEGSALPYGNDPAEAMGLGHARVRFGAEENSWDALRAASLSAIRAPVVPIRVVASEPIAALPRDWAADAAPLDPEQREFVTQIDRQLATALDQDLVVYVHGTKVDYRNAVAMTAEIDHFAGRDFVSVAFDWPSHQNILAYLLREDLHRAEDASQALHSLIELLAGHTRARNIHLLSYSAGANLASKALHELRQVHPDLEGPALRDRFRLGAVAFAAADVPLDLFLERLPAISEVSGQVVVTVSDHDPALIAAKRFMGHGLRAGMQEAEQAEEDLAEALGLHNFHVVDLSLGHETRGFDIEGHHYWYRHPWASSDVIFLLRTGLHPDRRGLTPGEREGIYYMSSEYPSEAREAVRRALRRSWGEVAVDEP